MSGVYLMKPHHRKSLASAQQRGDEHDMHFAQRAVGRKIRIALSYRKEHRAKRANRIARGTQILFDAKFEDLWRAVTKRTA